MNDNSGQGGCEVAQCKECGKLRVLAFSLCLDCRENTNFKGWEFEKSVTLRIQEMQRKIDLLLECVKFYANPENWHCEAITYGMSNERQECEFITSDDHESDYAGKRARECLEKIKEMK